MVSTSWLGGPEIGRELQARQVIQRLHRLVYAHLAGVGDPPSAVLAAGVTILVERRALDQHAVLGRDHGVLEPPRAGGRAPIDVDLRLARCVQGDDVRSELVAQERDDLIPAAELQRLAGRRRAVVRGGVGGEDLRHLLPPLQVDAAEVAVLHPADLFERDKVHATSFPSRLTFGKNLFYFFRTARRSRALLLCRVDDRPVVLRPSRPRRRGGRVRLDGGARQHLLPRARRQPFSPATGSSWGWGRARGARITRYSGCPGSIAGGAWTRRWPSCAGWRPGGTSSITGRSSTCRRSRSHPCRVSPCRSSSVVTGTPPSAVPPGPGTAGCTAGEIPRTCRACSPGWASSAGRQAPSAA